MRRTPVPYAGTEWDVPADALLVNGLGSVRSAVARARLWDLMKRRPAGAKFINVIHPAASIDPSAILGEGVQILAGAIVAGRAHLGDDVIVNTRAVVEHDCFIGDHSHIAPGAVLCGDVTVGARTHVGAGATVVQGVTLGHDVTVGAGAVVIRDVAPGRTVVGCPAK